MCIRDRYWRDRATTSCARERALRRRVEYYPARHQMPSENRGPPGDRLQLGILTVLQKQTRSRGPAKTPVDPRGGPRTVHDCRTRSTRQRCTATIREPLYCVLRQARRNPQHLLEFKRFGAILITTIGYRPAIIILRDSRQPASWQGRVRAPKLWLWTKKLIMFMHTQIIMFIFVWLEGHFSL